MSSPHDDNDTSIEGEQVALEQVREARQFHQLLSGAEEAARGDLWEIVEALTRQVDELRDGRVTTGSGGRQMESDMRWLDARVVLLEQALSDSRGEVATLRDYIDAYAAEMRLDIQDAAANARSERQQLIDELRDLAASNADLEGVLAQIRSESSDRIEGVAAELFEVADRTRHIAAEAHITASAAAERSQGLLDEIQDNVDKVEALAEQAQSADDLRGIAEEAQAVAQRSTDAVDEVRSIAEEAQAVAQRSTDAVDDLRVIAEEAQAVAASSAVVAEESNKSSSEVRAIAEEAQAVAVSSVAVAEESKKSSSEVRVIAEEAHAAAASSAVIAEDAHQAAKVSIEATEGVFAIAEEARTTASSNTQAVQEVHEVAQGAHAAVAETQEATEEIRVMTEKVKDLAERSADDVAAMQADVDARAELSDVNVTELSEEITRLKADVEVASGELRSGWEQMSSDMNSKVEAATAEVSQQLRAEVDASTESMQQDLRDEASSLRNETNALRAKVDDYAVGAPAAAPTEDINDLRNQLMELRHRMESLASSSDRRRSTTAAPPEQPRNTKRWVAHLDLTTVTPEPDLRALPAGSDDDEQARS